MIKFNHYIQKTILSKNRLSLQSIFYDMIYIYINLILQLVKQKVEYIFAKNITF